MAINRTYLNKHAYDAGIAITLLILITIGILTYRFLQLSTEYSKSVEHTHLVIDHLQTLLTSLVDAENGQRGFIITGKNEYLEPYDNALQHINSQIVSLRDLTKDDTFQQANLDGIQILIDRRLIILKQIIELRNSNGLLAAAREFDKDIDNAIMDSIRSKVANAQNQENYLLSERTQNYQMFTQWLNVILITGAITAVLILLIIIVLLKRETRVRTRSENELRVHQEHLNDLVKERTSSLKVSEKRWATTLASLADAVIATDETGRIVFMNTVAESASGWAREEALHKKLHEVFNIQNEEHLPVEDPFARVVKEGMVTGFTNHTILIRKNGEEIPIDNNGSRILRENGTLMGVVIVFHDSTQRKQAEEALRNQAALLNFAHDAIFVCNDENEITFWSRGAEETYGWSPENAAGQDINDLLKTQFPIPLEKINEEFQNTGEWNGELIHTRKDGREIIVTSRWALQRDIWGRHVATLEINRDITELKKLEESRNQLATFVEQADEAIFSVSLDGNILNWNQGAQKMYGYAGEDVKGKPVSLLIPSGHENEMTEILRKFRAGEIIRDYETVRMRKDGSEFIASITISPVKNLQGNVIGATTIVHDITGRKRAELALRESESNLEEAQRISHVGSWMLNVETSEISCTAETFRIYGEEPFSFQPTINIFLAYVYSEDREYVKSGVTELLAGSKQRMDLEFRIVRKNQTVRNIHSIGEIIEFTSDDKPYLIRGTGQDITERKQAEEAVQESESRLHLAQQVARIGSFEYDMVNDVSRWSPEMEILHGLNPGEYSGSYKQWKAFVYPNDLPKVEQLLLKAIETGKFDTEWRIVRADGDIRWMAVRGQVFKDYTGKPVRMVGVNLDITEGKKAEQEVKIAAERFRLITSSNIVGCAIVDFDGAVYFANDYFLHIVGYSRQEFEQGLINWKSLTPPEYVPLDIQAREQLLSMGTCTPYEKQFVLRDTTRPWIYTSAALFPDTQQLFSFVIDITERKKAEEALKRYTEELAAANRDLESFSYSVSHDLRNPVGLIGGFTDFLIEDYSDKLGEEGKDYLRRIDGAVRKMQSIINDMLALSRIGRQEMKKENINLCAIVRNYIAELKETEPRRRIELIVENNVQGYADPQLIHLALENLLRNAWKFTSKKDITRIEFGTILKENQTVFFIRDNGEGFDMKFAEKIFEPFKRGHAEKEFGGTGVGLSIVQRVIGRHGGTVWAEGGVGEGATFYFTLG